MEPSERAIQRCSELSAVFFSALVQRHNITYNQILYPYADALSLCGNPGTMSTRIFGTHILLRGVEVQVITNVMEEILSSGGLGNSALSYDVVEFRLYDGAALACDMAEFLCGEEGLRSVGDFGGMLGGFVAHWRIRECARVFASFSEMAYRRAKGAVCGLYGGRLVLSSECDCAEALSEIFTQKTGCR